MKNHDSGPRIAVIQGSVRPSNYTAKALALVLDEFHKKDVEVTLIDPAVLNLPLPGTDSSSGELEDMKKTIKDATGVVIGTPEYHGSYSSVIKLVIENLGFPSALQGKPVALLGVAAGRIGAIKSLEHLRSVCSHVGAIVLPSFVSVANVQKLFDEEGNCLDSATEKLVRGVAVNMFDYIHDNLCPRITLERMMREDVLQD